MNKKKKRNLFLLLFLVLFVSVGYALLSTTLNINGTTKVKDAKWNIYWDNPQVTTGSVTTTKPTIDSLKTTASFNVTLEKPGDFYEFTIDAKNAGTIDGMISAVSYKLNDTEIGIDNPLPAYLNYTVTYSDDVALEANQILAANTSEKYKVRVEFKKDIDKSQLPGQEVTLSLKFAVTYVQADGNATGAHPSAITYINRQVEGQITPGDVIGIGETEDFYVISSDENNTVLLAKYNLMVGYYSELGYSDEFDEYLKMSSDTPGYGLQSVDAVGYIGDGSIGTIRFSDNNYWLNNNELLSQYSMNNTIYLDSSEEETYDWRFRYRDDDSEAYPYIYDSNSNIYPYISGNDGYVNRLKTMGAPSTITGRILSYEEAIVAENLNILNNEQEFWIESAGVVADDYDTGIWRYRQGLAYSDFGGGCGPIFGIRPVIEIPTSELQ